MLNHIVLMGRLTRDPELRYTQSQIPVASFRLAVDRDFGRGEERQTDFIDCVAWRQTGEFVSKYFQKGSMAVVSGRLQMRDWTDKDGNKRTTAEVVADNVYFGESKRREGEPGTAMVPGTATAPATVTATATATVPATATGRETAGRTALRARPRLPPFPSWTTGTANCRSEN